MGGGDILRDPIQLLPDTVLLGLLNPRRCMHKPHSVLHQYFCGHHSSRYRNLDLANINSRASSNVPQEKVCNQYRVLARRNVSPKNICGIMCFLSFEHSVCFTTIIRVYYYAKLSLDDITCKYCHPLLILAEGSLPWLQGPLPIQPSGQRWN